MATDRARLESMLFNHTTTYLTDYRHGEITEPVLTSYQKKPTFTKPRPPPLKDTHTLSDRKTAASIPFSLLHTPKDITGISPTKLQAPYTKPVDTNREEAQKTRPRLVMTPAVSMDDVTDPRARNILCSDMYTSDMTRGQREAVSPYFSVKAPLPGLPTHSNPVALPKLSPPVVPPEWRMETVSWDGKQLRASCDATKLFWLGRDVSKCQACYESATVDANRKMEHKMKTNRR